MQPRHVCRAKQSGTCVPVLLLLSLSLLPLLPPTAARVNVLRPQLSHWRVSVRRWVRLLAGALLGLLQLQHLEGGKGTEWATVKHLALVHTCLSLLA